MISFPLAIFVFFSAENPLTVNLFQSLRKMNHSNIVKLKEVVRENDILYFVFEYMVFHDLHL